MPRLRWGSGERGRETDRVEAFSDAVIAIVLTLMAVELLQVPSAAEGERLADALAHEWPKDCRHSTSEDEKGLGHWQVGSLRSRAAGRAVQG